MDDSLSRRVRRAHLTALPFPPNPTGATPEPGPAAADFAVSERSAAYRERFHPDATPADWSDWTWQLRNRLRRLDDVLRVLVLSEDERKTIERIGGRLPLGVTPYYTSLMDPLDPADPIRRSMIPVGGELVRGLGEADDPLGEDNDSPVPGLVHRYPDRVLFLVTNFCATYCRYCTRARLVGHTGEYHFNNAQYQQALDYIASGLVPVDDLITHRLPLVRVLDAIEIVARGDAIKVTIEP